MTTCALLRERGDLTDAAIGRDAQVVIMAIVVPLATRSCRTAIVH